jgi:phosphoribosylglycinamide formyltransferase 1
MTSRLTVLASGGGSNLQAIIDACVHGTLNASVGLLVADRDNIGAIERARRHSIPTRVVAPAGADRRGYDARLADVVADSNPDFVVLAGWRRLLTMAFLGRFPTRVINLHPALPGDLPGLGAIERAHIEAAAGGRSHTGVMVHFVPDEGVDDGPVIATRRVPIVAGESLAALEARVHAAEHELLIAALRTVVAQEALP